jgi:hypothetical protein
VNVNGTGYVPFATNWVSISCDWQNISTISISEQYCHSLWQRLGNRAAYLVGFFIDPRSICVPKTFLSEMKKETGFHGCSQHGSAPNILLAQHLSTAPTIANIASNVAVLIDHMIAGPSAQFLIVECPSMANVAHENRSFPAVQRLKADCRLRHGGNLVEQLFFNVVRQRKFFRKVVTTKEEIEPTSP